MRGPASLIGGVVREVCNFYAGLVNFGGPHQVKTMFSRNDAGDEEVAAMMATISIGKALEEYRAWRLAFEAQLRDAGRTQWGAEHFFRKEHSAFGRLVHGTLATRFARHRAYPDLAEAHAALLDCAAALQNLAAGGRRDAAAAGLKDGAYAALCRRVQRALISMQRPDEVDAPVVDGGLRAA